MQQERKRKFCNIGTNARCRYKGWRKFWLKICRIVGSVVRCRKIDSRSAQSLYASTRIGQGLAHLISVARATTTLGTRFHTGRWKLPTSFGTAPKNSCERTPVNFRSRILKWTESEGGKSSHRRAGTKMHNLQCRTLPRLSTTSPEAQYF